ncbi:MAG TPA: hypothetical protein VFN21_00600 [Acidimicrobiales bacterium]|nr:hypothetical protein [Acidimicrobiales bacterium]
MTASEASRGFAAVLDAAEVGETIVVTRGGRRVAEIRPAQKANGAALRAVLERWHGNASLDDPFATAVDSIRDATSGELDNDPWRD